MNVEESEWRGGKKIKRTVTECIQRGEEEKGSTARRGK